jgi:CelD/BcsL family acetyltransferase involved in cellulose biosynthesis
MLLRRAPQGDYRVRIAEARRLPEATVAAWSALESRALEPNAYLSPHFILPALRYLDPAERVLAFLIEAVNGGAGAAGRLLGVGLFRVVPATHRFPVPHLIAYRSRHSYLSGLLLDGERATAALDALLDELRAQRWRWHGIEFEGVWGDGPTHALLQAAAERRGMGRQEWNPHTRAVLLPIAQREALTANIAAESKDLKRRRRRLDEQGHVSWALHRRGGIPEKSIEAFLDLEQRGWKGETKTALRSAYADEAFFREAVTRFETEGRMVVTELTLDNRVIASTTNFVSGRAGFAFKIGWLPELAKVSPGVLNEMEMLRRLYEDDGLTDLDFWDSGASQGSFIDKLWPGRRPLVSMTLASTSLSRTVMGLLRGARTVRKHYLARKDARSAATKPPTSSSAT